jgi:hypothetical protein
VADDIIIVAEPDATQKKLVTKKYTVGAHDVHFEGTFELGPSVAAVTRPTVTAASSQILAANANRARVVVVNETDVWLYLKYGATASPIDYTHRIGPGEERVLPLPAYTGRIDAILASGSSAVQLTEETRP